MTVDSEELRPVWFNTDKPDPTADSTGYGPDGYDRRGRNPDGHDPDGYDMWGLDPAESLGRRHRLRQHDA